MAKIDVQQIKQRFDIIGNSPDLLRSIDVAIQVAATDLSVLITGESGVGKEIFPQIIHKFSQRKHGSYIAVNCGAIPEGTIDSELFGHEKGSFTGALSDRKGYFEEANGGTIFLDEVGELPTSTQARLLRILESGEYIKVGSSKVQKTDVRIVAATNINFEKAISEGKFREDLYYRLNSVPIHVPPLRDRGSDIVLLFRKFAADAADKYRMPPVVLDDSAKRLLLEYRFPGNVRQLKNITEQISVLEQSREVDNNTLLKYLPNMQNLPAIREKEKEDRVFGSEREILYQVLFDMRSEVHELKRLVHNLMKARESEATAIPNYKNPDTIISTATSLPNSVIPLQKEQSETVPFTESIDLENVLTLNDLEKELIAKSLERNKGRRKLVADELEISERTLYRKIKDYGLDQLY